ncbi:MAG: GTP 3',8-cyclase MoaA [Abitibacteriaceae bacterium]|nr:GTP 3',8-cyclase MoaA [Abditibacteriaceae bacterium]
MLCDRHHRVISYLRISVTERCNFRCVYCMPAAGIQLAPRAHLLTYEEIARVVQVGAKLGLSKIRLTGGEPTVRRDLPDLVAMLAAIDGINEITMTTNGVLLASLAQPLKAAGLRRVNISLDTLQPERAAALARRDYFDAVLRGIDAARDAGLTPLKLNAVVMRGVNDDELADLVSFAHSKGAQMRFIEYMPMGVARLNEQNKLMTAREMLERLKTHFDLTPEQDGDLADPARGWVCQRTGARVGFITSISEHFCDTCNRMRLTAEGGLRPCLHQDAEVDVRSILRSNGSDVAIEQAYRDAANLKWAGHHMNDVIPLYSAKEMVAIGG